MKETLLAVLRHHPFVAEIEPRQRGESPQPRLVDDRARELGEPAAVVGVARQWDAAETLDHETCRPRTKSLTA